jgi:probable F420-dependent oxidoreductase
VISGGADGATTLTLRTMPHRPVRIAVQLQPQHADYDQIRRAVQATEAIGADVAFNWDHFFPLSGDPDGKHFECWTMLAAWAEQTTRLEFGALVTCNSYRNPELLADMARTIDHISGGRLILGIGSGWFERDYVEYGYEFGTAGGRLDALAEALPRLEQRLGQVHPAPTRKIPVLIGGGGERKTLRLVAKHADIWHTYSVGDELQRKLDVLAGHCAAVDRPFDEIEISGHIPTGGSASVEPGALRARAEQLRVLGVTLVQVAVNGPDYDLTSLEHLIAWRDEVNAS